MGSSCIFHSCFDSKHICFTCKVKKGVLTISGTYRYHDSTGQISECSDAVLDITRFDAGALFSYKQFATSTNSRISNDKKSVTFSARFSITLSYNALNVPGITWWTEDFGPYSNSVTGRV